MLLKKKFYQLHVIEFKKELITKNFLSFKQLVKFLGSVYYKNRRPFESIK